jgi:hypothetical protein
VHSANGNIPASPGNNTLINPGATGAVGIGLSSGAPNAKLDIDLGVWYDQKEAGLRITVPESPKYGPTTTNPFQVRKGFVNPISGAFSYKDYMVVKDDGHVGMGISDPESKLHVHQGQIKLTGNNSYGGPMVLFGGSPTSAPYGQWGIEYVPASNGSPGLNFWKPGGSINAGNHYLFLSNNGKVSIGLDPNLPTTFNGNYKLYVAEGIMTEKIKVALESTASWADYVFDADYKLMTLNEVESFISEHGHLPNVRSAEEVVKEGIDMAEMDAKLLEKIEELTLYILEQDKRIHELENTINPAK